MYRASRFQELWLLRLPSALPYFLAGLRISGGLALIGAIVAEIAAGTAGKSAGLAFRIVNSGFRLNIPRMFAALLLIAVVGVLIHLILTALTYFLLRDWHDSARRERLDSIADPRRRGGNLTLAVREEWRKSIHLRHSQERATLTGVGREPSVRCPLSRGDNRTFDPWARLADFGRAALGNLEAGAGIPR